MEDGGTERGFLGVHRFPRDLLQGFARNACAVAEQQQEQREATGGDSEEIELSLGLSIGGCFGEEPKGKKLVRSSSIASFSSLPWEPPEFPPAFPTLARASSLPSEIQEELRKRKELQSLKRLEAKRKRHDRRNSIKSGVAAKAVEKLDEVAVSPSVMATDDAVEFAGGSQSRPGARNAAASPVCPPAAGVFSLATQKSIGTQGSCSTGVSAQGFGSISRSNSCNKTMSLANGKMLAASAGAGGGGDDGAYPCKKAAGARGDAIGLATKDVEKSMMEQMPSVSTRGDGPDGRRVDWFLYKYNKGEQVSIVCVCHGSFLTPAEFVKHAGGGDVSHPLRHIVVNPSSSFASL